MGRYWDQAGKHQQAYDRLFDQLVPSSGKCETRGGEALRAATRLYYDAFNNGGCNFTGQAWDYIDRNVTINAPDESCHRPELLNEALEEVKYLCFQTDYVSDRMLKSLLRDQGPFEVIVDQCTLFALSSSLADLPAEDMFDEQYGYESEYITEE